MNSNAIPSFTSIAVGEPYPCADFRFGGQMLKPAPAYEQVFALENPTPQEINDCKAGSKLRLALAEVDDMLFWLYKPGTMPWCDMAVWLPSNYDSKLEQIRHDLPTSRYLFNFILVDAATNLVANIRATTISRTFALKCAELVDRQTQRCYSISNSIEH